MPDNKRLDIEGIGEQAAAPEEIERQSPIEPLPGSVNRELPEERPEQKLGEAKEQEQVPLSSSDKPMIEMIPDQGKHIPVNKVESVKGNEDDIIAVFRERGIQNEN
ncbi:MAG: hypothetical protein UY65_C0010G0005 [Parcubacteria group bacterium GW2011_GWA2_51_12]|nr:MAG: hypothetical protein UY65_C0010G0005 [Parcubacteria group bacterium GW2011_GWA2_51_12]